MKNIFADTSWMLLNGLFPVEYTNVFFITDNVKLHKTNRKGNRVIYLPPYSPFLNPIEKFVLEIEVHFTNSSMRSENDLFNEFESISIELMSFDCDGYYQNMLK
ncbi:hypothetical protein RF11_02954 [Thelohanellus kitauei]|uniref:Tc1-like transposase DDE domain-containing protein n=1 Tax=Thelohanellus kitauei TaxID=669202 RepID=A0A0C2JPY0_THEKT|nr:hypothetical protein RF11_02954 [Thelohanellus kitauei]